MAAEGSALDAGAYVRIEGLQRGTQHNGRYGFVVGHEGERLSVVTAHSDVLLNVKPANLIPEHQDRTSKTHEVVMVYPNAGGPNVAKPDAASMLVAAGESSPLVRLALGLEGGDAMDSRIIGLETTRVRLRGDTRHEPTTRPHDLRRRRIHALPREHARPSRDRETSDV